jgi:hypothetical protein
MLTLLASQVIWLAAIQAANLHHTPAKRFERSRETAEIGDDSAIKLK